MKTKSCSYRKLLKQKIMRLLTLVCFFHFSGLNNGFSYVVATCGKIQTTNFAPVLISKTVHTLNPLHWKKLIQEKRWVQIFSSSGKVIEISSQRLIQNMLTESLSIQSWVKEMVKVKTNKEQISSSIEMIERGGELLNSSHRLELEDGGEYAFSGREEMWVKSKKVRILDWGRYKDFKLEGLLNKLRWRWNSFSLGLDDYKVKIKNANRFGVEKFIRRVAYEIKSSNKSDEDELVNNGFKNKDTRHSKMAGIFFVWGRHFQMVEKFPLFS